MRIRLRVLRFRLRVLSFRLRVLSFRLRIGVLNLENVFGECEKALLFYIPPLLHWNTASTPATVQALARACPWLVPALLLRRAIFSTPRRVSSTRFGPTHRYSRGFWARVSPLLSVGVGACGANAWKRRPAPWEIRCTPYRQLPP